MVKLVEEEGRTMFVCEVDENLTLDEFETSNADNDEELSIETLRIQNIAANTVGEHECLYELRSFKHHVKLMVTGEANSQSDITVNSKFKAEIVVPVDIANDVKTNGEMLIQCPNSGEHVRVRHLCAGAHYQFLIFLFSSQEISCVWERSNRLSHDSCLSHLTLMHMKARRLSYRVREKAIRRLR